MFPPVSFRIQTQWSFTARIAEVADILGAPEDFPRWWPKVYLAVKTIERGDARGIGQTLKVHSRGWLPYHLHWQGKLVENHMPDAWVIEATGDLVGRGVWRLEQHGPIALVSYDWQVGSDRLLFRLLAPLLRRVMVSNHNWAMRKGQIGLRAELARRSSAASPG